MSGPPAIWSSAYVGPASFESQIGEMIAAGRCYVQQILVASVRRLLSGGVAGTKRVRELGHARARAATTRALKTTRTAGRTCPRVPANGRACLSRRSLVNEGILGSSPSVGFLNSWK